jgi:hypothetical protein
VGNELISEIADQKLLQELVPVEPADQVPGVIVIRDICRVLEMIYPQAD